MNGNDIWVDREKVNAQMKRNRIKRFAHLAELMEVRRATLSEWFSGQDFSAKNLGKLCRVLGCSPNDVLGWHGEKRTKRDAASAGDA